MSGKTMRDCLGMAQEYSPRCDKFSTEKVAVPFNLQFVGIGFSILKFRYRLSPFCFQGKIICRIDLARGK